MLKINAPVSVDKPSLSVLVILGGIIYLVAVPNVPDPAYAKSIAALATVVPIPIAALPSKYT